MRRVHYDASSSSEDDDGLQGVVGEFDARMHAFLCGQTAANPGFFLGPYEGEWEEVKRKGRGAPGRGPGKHHPGNRKIPTKAEANPEMVERFSRIFRDYFYGVTGRQIAGFMLTPSSHKYVSMLPSARERDRVLSTLFQTRPVIWDLMAGSGADVMAFLLDLNPKVVVACQRAMMPDDRDESQYTASLQEFNTMERNIRSFVQAFPEMKIIIRSSMDQNMLGAGEEEEDEEVPAGLDIPPTVKCKHLHAERFIDSQKEGTEVDMIYLDPSWDDDYEESAEASRRFELTPTELFQRLETIIWGPIKRKKIKVGCYVIKTRWNWLKVQQYLPTINSEFIATYSIRAQPFRRQVGAPGPYGQKGGVFHYMVLVHREYQTIAARNNQMYWDIVREGKPVWVKRDTVVHPVRPVYSNQINNPVFVEADPHDLVGYFMVQPPPPLAPGARGGPDQERPTPGYYDGLPSDTDASRLSPGNTSRARTG
jgi:hypothetical protein